MGKIIRPLSDKELFCFVIGIAWVVIGTWLYLFDAEVSGRWSAIVVVLAVAAPMAFYFLYWRNRSSTQRTRGK